MALCVVIWFYGYLVSFGNFKPFDTTQARLIAISVILLIWVIYIAVTLFRARKQDKERITALEKKLIAFVKCVEI